jgi:hypothetical protein
MLVATGRERIEKDRPNLMDSSFFARLFRRAFQTSLVAFLASTACSGSGGSSGSGPKNVGQPCSQPSQCYPALQGDAAGIQGQITCLTQVSGGYCTHTCASDADCCAVPGECTPGFKEVCASFESTAQMYCFLSCDPNDIAGADAGTTDPATYCATWAWATSTCRSTGGGSANRKFCG